MFLQFGGKRFEGVQPPNSALKLTVRLSFSRRPSRLPRLEFARRRATCTGIIGCAASGAPLNAGRPPAARNLTSRRWADGDIALRCIPQVYIWRIPRFAFVALVASAALVLTLTLL